MTWFSLPKRQANNTAAFFDADGASRWLSTQPQANAALMVAELLRQIEALNGFSIPARERFKILEVLRKSVFSASGESSRRYENKPLPLLPAEQLAFETARRLWRAFALAYLHCLRACLDGDRALLAHSARVAHRVLASLRMEQAQCYLAGSELAAEFWSTLHAVFASAEQLDVQRAAVEDRLLGETTESTVCGQYCMILLLHLARPCSLPRLHYAAAVRWLARWREQAAVLLVEDSGTRATCLPLDLLEDQPIHDGRHVASVARWLSLGSVLRKLRKRLKALAEGESPEDLKLGRTLSPEACEELLSALANRLVCPLSSDAGDVCIDSAVGVVPGTQAAFYALGGRGLKDAASGSNYGTHLNHEQIAVFGHVIRDSESGSEVPCEQWALVRQDEAGLHLQRPVLESDERLRVDSLLAIQWPHDRAFRLATVCSLHVRKDGRTALIASWLPGSALPLLAEAREKAGGRLSRHPAFGLSVEPLHNEGASEFAADENELVSLDSVILPAGLSARSASIKFYSSGREKALPFGLHELEARGPDSERWSLLTVQ